MGGRGTYLGSCWVVGWSIPFGFPSNVIFICGNSVFPSRRLCRFILVSVTLLLGLRGSPYGKDTTCAGHGKCFLGACRLSRGCSTSANFDFGQFRLRPIRLRTIRLRPTGRSRIGRSRNWPKSKLAEVENNWPKSNRWCLLCFFFLSFFFFFLLCLFTLLYFFSCSYSSLSSFLFLFCFCFRPQKSKLMHPISDGPFRWTPPPLDNPPLDNPPPDNPPPDNPPPDRPKFRSFFSLLPPQFSFFFPSLWVLSLHFVGV